MRRTEWRGGPLPAGSTTTSGSPSANRDPIGPGGEIGGLRIRRTIKAATAAAARTSATGIHHRAGPGIVSVAVRWTGAGPQGWHARTVYVPGSSSSGMSSGSSNVPFGPCALARMAGSLDVEGSRKIRTLPPSGSHPEPRTRTRSPGPASVWLSSIVGPSGPVGPTVPGWTTTSRLRNSEVRSVHGWQASTR